MTEKQGPKLMHEELEEIGGGGVDNEAPPPAQPGMR